MLHPVKGSIKYGGNKRNDSEAYTLNPIPELRSQLEQRRARVTPQADEL